MAENISNLKRHHKDSLFRVHFIEPDNFLDLLAYCRGNVSTLTVDDIQSFDLASALAVRTRRNDVAFITRDNRIIILVEHQRLCQN